MMDGLATATIVASTRIMKKPTIIAQSARHGSATGPAPPAGLRRSAVVISPTSSRLLPMVSISPAQRQRNRPVLQDFTKPGSRATCPSESVSKSVSDSRLVARSADVLTNPLLAEAVTGRSYAAVHPIGDPGRLNE